MKSASVESASADNPYVTGRPYEDYFDLQLRFAARYAELTGDPLREAVARCTNLRRRLGLWGALGEDRWAVFLEQVQGCSDHAGLLQIAMAAHDCAPRRDLSPYGCFTYDPPDAQGALRLHFMPEERHRQTRPLSEGSLPERRGELRALFYAVRRLHPEVRQVRGLSWLYHVRAYKSLFPEPYIASLTSPVGPLHMNGSSVWGQVLDYRARLKAGIAEIVLSRLEKPTVVAPRFAFPLQPLAAACSVDHFFDSVW